MDSAKIVILAGGSFQGKSLISLSLANTLRFSGVITTDTIRNILKILEPEQDHWGISSYMLAEDSLAKQMETVSNMIRKIIGIYQERGEHMIIEGMHFSREFMRWAKLQGFCCLCINNEKDFRERIELKKVTRSRLRGNSNMNDESFSFENSNYFKYQDRIREIHSKILEDARSEGFEIVTFNELEIGIERSLAYIKSWSS